MPTKIVLKNPGDECVMECAAVELVRGNMGEDWMFTGTSGDRDVAVYVPAKSAASRFERMNIEDPADLAGRIVRIARSEKVGKNGKPFWDIDLPAGVNATTGVSQRQATTNGKSADKSNGRAWVPVTWKQVAKAYDECVAVALHEAKRIEKDGRPVTGADVHAMTATLMIARDKVSAWPAVSEDDAT